MRLTPRSALLTGPLIVLAVGLAGCGDDDDGGGAARAGGVGSAGVEAAGTFPEEDVVASTTGDVEVTVEVTSPPSPSVSSASGDEGGDDVVVPDGYMAVTITVTAADGSTEEFCVWLAETSSQHQQGLMEVTDLDGAVGMLFAYDSEVGNNFWMVNTPMPLSIAFFRDDGSFISATDMEPCLDTDTSECERYSATDAYQYALEVPRGDLDALGIGDGTTVTLQRSTQTEACRPA